MISQPGNGCWAIHLPVHVWPVLHTLLGVCVYLILYSIIAYRFLWPHSYDRKQFPHEDPLCYSYRAVAISFCHRPHPSLATTSLVSISISTSFQACHINWIIQYVIFWDWHFLLTVIPSNIFWSLENMIF